MYQMIVPTLCDSTTTNGFCWSIYKVRAYTENQLLYFDSLPDSGYSVDNLTPTALQSFHSAVVGKEIVLTWILSELPEDGVPVVYRLIANTGDFARIHNPNIAATDLTWTFHDKTCQPGVEYRYRVVLDYDGESLFLFESDPVSVPSLPLTLFQNYPNPFTPATKIGFFLPEDNLVSLTVYNATGQRVSVLVNRAFKSGQRTIEWNGVDDGGNRAPSGVYFYRLQAGSRTLTRKMVFFR